MICDCFRGEDIIGVVMIFILVVFVSGIIMGMWKKWW